jgi:hypothetical protein
MVRCIFIIIFTFFVSSNDNDFCFFFLNFSAVFRHSSISNEVANSICQQFSDLKISGFDLVLIPKKPSPETAAMTDPLIESKCVPVEVISTAAGSDESDDVIADKELLGLPPCFPYGKPLANVPMPRTPNIFETERNNGPAVVTKRSEINGCRLRHRAKKSVYLPVFTLLSKQLNGCAWFENPLFARKCRRRCRFAGKVLSKARMRVKVTIISIICSFVYSAVISIYSIFLTVTARTHLQCPMPR